MNKRSAMLVAAGIVLALVVAGVAVATGITGPSPSRTAVAAPGGKASPVVKTITETVRVHKTAEPASTPTIVRTSSSDPVGVDDDASVDPIPGDDSFEEDDSFEDDGAEDHDEDGVEIHDDEDHADDDD